MDTTTSTTTATAQTQAPAPAPAPASHLALSAFERDVQAIAGLLHNFIIPIGAAVASAWIYNLNSQHKLMVIVGEANLLSGVLAQVPALAPQQ